MNIFSIQGTKIEILKYLSLQDCQNLRLVNKLFTKYLNKKIVTQYYDNWLKSIRYNYYQDGTEKINFNWIGKYTFGSTFFRGTRLCIRPEFGEIISQYRLLSGNPDEEINFNNLILTEKIMFWEDEWFRIEFLSEFSSEFSSGDYIVKDATKLGKIIA